MTNKAKVLAIVEIVAILGLLVALFSPLIVALNVVTEETQEQQIKLDNLKANGYHYQGQSNIPIDEYQVIIKGIDRGKFPTILQSDNNTMTIYYDFCSLSYFPELQRIEKLEQK